METRNDRNSSPTWPRAGPVRSHARRRGHRREFPRPRARRRPGARRPRRHRLVRHALGRQLASGDQAPGHRHHRELVVDRGSTLSAPNQMAAVSEKCTACAQGRPCAFACPSPRQNAIPAAGARTERWESAIDQSSIMKTESFQAAAAAPADTACPDCGDPRHLESLIEPDGKPCWRCQRTAKPSKRPTARMAPADGRGFR